LRLVEEVTADGIRFLEAIGRELGRNHYKFADSLSTWINKSVSYGISESGWDSVSKILLRPWWKRVWVLQEVAVAKQVLVLCGNKGTHLKNFAALMAVVATSNISCLTPAFVDSIAIDKMYVVSSICAIA
jgi:hypothetical protein